MDIAESGADCPFAKGQGYVFDKGYCDYQLGVSDPRSGLCFVTRLKSNAGIQPRGGTEPLLDPQQPQILARDHLVKLQKHRRPGGQTHQRVLRHPVSPK